MAYIDMCYKSESLARAVKIQIILPSHEGGGDNVYPCKTLYFLHGFNGNAEELTRFLPFTMQSLMHKMAIVLCDGNNSFYADKQDGISNYRKFVEEELVRVTRELFPLSHKREDTYIGGISMGGHGAIVTGFSQLNTFSKVAVMSPCINYYQAEKESEEIPFSMKTLDLIFGKEEKYLQSDRCCNGAVEKALNNNCMIPEVFIGCGKQDPLVYRQQKEFAENLKDKGISVTYEEMDGSHDIFLWQKMLGDLFVFLEKEEDNE